MSTHAGWVMAVFALLVTAAWAQEDSLSNFSRQQQFLDQLGTHQEQNREAIGRNDREILQLENSMASERAEEARRQADLSRLNATPGGMADEMQREQERQRALFGAEQARSRREQLHAELQRRRSERARLGADATRLQRLQSEYDANPGRAGELMHDIDGR